jgi:hypothetical protein
VLGIDVSRNDDAGFAGVQWRFEPLGQHSALRDLLGGKLGQVFPCRTGSKLHAYSRLAQVFFQDMSAPAIGRLDKS